MNQALEKETRYQGKFYLSGTLFRLENETPDKSLLLFDGENIWSEQGASKDFNTGPQIAKTQINKANNSQMLLSSLLGGKDLASSFSMLDEGTVNGESTFALTPKTSDPTIKNLKMSINNKSGIVSQVSYVDDIGNKTTMVFSNVNFAKSLQDQKLFKYTPPKGAQVNSL
jgi:outer membrane lipoprotein carrier protein